MKPLRCSAFLTLVMAILLTNCSAPNPCSDHRVVKALLEDTASNRQLTSLGIIGGKYDVELDDGHVYEAIYGEKPPLPGETAHLCVEVSTIDGSRHYSIALARNTDDANGNRKAILAR
jgi:hypothetical protein